MGIGAFGVATVSSHGHDLHQPSVESLKLDRKRNRNTPMMKSANLDAAPLPSGLNIRGQLPTAGDHREAIEIEKRESRHANSIHRKARFLQDGSESIRG